MTGVALEPNRLLGLHWTFPTSYRFARDRLVVPLVASEIMRAAHEFPIGFAEIDGRWRPAAYLADAAGTRNRFVGREGDWTASYIPYWLRVHPFVERERQGGLTLDPGFVGARGSFAFVGDDGKLTARVLSVDRQIKLALAGLDGLCEASALLCETAAEEAPSGGRGGMRFVGPAQLEAAIAADASRWLARSPKAVELAIVSAFASVHLPRRELGVSLGALPAQRLVPAAPRAAEPPERPFSTVPSDLDWLDLGEKIDLG